ncbi:MAG: efflux RND transporter permease subunit, partial [Rhodospirillales bacterium]
MNTRKSSPDLMMVVNILSPDGTFDELYVSNYALTRVRDQLIRLDGVGDVLVFGAREYAIRVWLDPERLAAYGLSAGDVVRALREQNVQVSGGALGTPPSEGAAFQIPILTQGRFDDPRQFREVIVKSGGEGRIVR